MARACSQCSIDASGVGEGAVTIRRISPVEAEAYGASEIPNDFRIPHRLTALRQRE